MKQLNTQAMEKALGHIVQNLGVDCLKDSKRFSSAIADLLPGFEYEAERKALCACICSEVSEKIINEKQYTALNSCVKYLTSQQKLTEQQANELVKVLTHVLWKEASSGSSQVSNSATKNTVTSQATVIHSTTADNTSSTKQTTPTAKEPTWRDPTSNISTTKQTATTRSLPRRSLGRSKTGQHVGFEFYDYTGVEQEKIKKAAEQGDAWAQFYLGEYYRCDKYNGCANKNKDYVEAVKWFRRAAKQGYAEAQYKLGNCYYYGLGVSQDYIKAEKWYRKAAEHGNADAMACLQWFCKSESSADTSNNIGQKTGSEIAVDLHKKAEQGDAEAQCELGKCYYYGCGGVSKDYANAAIWFRKAADQGNNDAREYLRQLGNKDDNGDGCQKDTCICCICYIILILFILRPIYEAIWPYG